MTTGTNLATTLRMEKACELLGISKWTGYELVKRGEFPVPLVHLGRAIRIPTRPLLDLLGIDAVPAPPPPSGATSASSATTTNDHPHRDPAPGPQRPGADPITQRAYEGVIPGGNTAPPTRIQPSDRRE